MPEFFCLVVFKVQTVKIPRHVLPPKAIANALIETTKRNCISSVRAFLVKILHIPVEPVELRESLQFLNPNMHAAYGVLLGDPIRHH